MATGLTLSSSSNLSSVSSTVIASAISQIEPAGPTNQLVSRYDIPQGAKQVDIPIWGRNNATALTEGVDIATPQQLSVTIKNVTSSEHGILVFVSDRLTRQNNEDIFSPYQLFICLCVRTSDSDPTISSSCPCKDSSFVLCWSTDSTSSR